MKSFVHTIGVRFRDCDSLGHINNAVYHTYVEACRCQWLHDALELPVFERGAELPVVIARAEMDFLAQGFMGNDIVVTAKLSHIGNKSFHQVYTIEQDERLLAKCKSFLVWFDFEKQTSVPIPQEVRRVMEPYLEVES